MLEDGLKKRLMVTSGFPFTQLLAEFRRRLPQPLKKVLWSRPDFEGLMVGGVCYSPNFCLLYIQLLLFTLKIFANAFIVPKVISVMHQY